MDLSVVIVTRDTKDLTLAALASLPAGCEGVSWEAVVVDNGSSDGTAEAVRGALAGAKVVSNPENLGYAAAANQGWRRGEGSVVLFLNSDARLARAAGAVLARFLAENPGVAAAGAQLVDEDGSLQNSIDAAPSLATELLNKPLLRRVWPERYPGKRQAYERPTAVETLVGACMAVRRDCLETLGGFDEQFFFFMEETDLCMRAADAGWGVYLVPAARCTHLQGRTARSRYTQARIEYFRSRYRLFRKHRGPGATALLAAGLLLRLALSTALAGVACIVTLGLRERARRRLAASVALLAWHLALCPARAGLPRPARREAA